jgi:hypothetical protein
VKHQEDHPGYNKLSNVLKHLPIFILLSFTVGKRYTTSTHFKKYHHSYNLTKINPLKTIKQGKSSIILHALLCVYVYYCCVTCRWAQWAAVGGGGVRGGTYLQGSSVTTSLSMGLCHGFYFSLDY